MVAIVGGNEFYYSTWLVLQLFLNFLVRTIADQKHWVWKLISSEDQPTGINLIRGKEGI